MGGMGQLQSADEVVLNIVEQQGDPFGHLIWQGWIDLEILFVCPGELPHVQKPN